MSFAYVTTLRPYGFGHVTTLYVLLLYVGGINSRACVQYNCALVMGLTRKLAYMDLPLPRSSFYRVKECRKTRARPDTARDSQLHDLTKQEHLDTVFFCFLRFQTPATPHAHPFSLSTDHVRDDQSGRRTAGQRVHEVCSFRLITGLFDMYLLYIARLVLVGSVVV